MIVKIYFDVYSYSTPDNIYPTTCPAKKLPDATRYLIEVDVPDPAQPNKILKKVPQNVEDVEHHSV